MVEAGYAHNFHEFAKEVVWFAREEQQGDKWRAAHAKPTNMPGRYAGSRTRIFVRRCGKPKLEFLCIGKNGNAGMPSLALSRRCRSRNEYGIHNRVEAFRQ